MFPRALMARLPRCLGGLPKAKKPVTSAEPIEVVAEKNPAFQAVLKELIVRSKILVDSKYSLLGRFPIQHLPRILLQRSRLRFIGFVFEKQNLAP